MRATEAALEHTAATDQLRARAELLRLFKRAPMADTDEIFNLGLYCRSGLLVKFLLMADLYQRVLSIPGLLVEFGVWYGQNLVLMENLRAIYEPFNRQRKVVGFDSFEGYEGGRLNGLYRTGPQYVRYLAKLLETHERCNVYGHDHGHHELVEGDVTDTAPAYFAAHPEATVALAYFDMGPEEPTVAALRAIKPHLVKGSIIVLDEFTWPQMPGEARAFKRVFARSEYEIESHPLYRTKAVVTIL